MRNFIFIALGCLSVLLGTIGIFLPLLPTTVFLILASYFFIKGSPKLNQKLLKNKYFGPYIVNYREHRAMPLKSKITAIVMLWCSICFSIFYVDNTAIQFLLFTIAIGVTLYLLSLKTLKISS